VINLRVVFTRRGEVAIEERPVPVPGPGEILVETVCSLISPGTELTILRGDFPGNSRWADYAKFPFLPGYANVGKVVELGEGVGREWKGKKIATYSPHSAFVTCPLESARMVTGDVSDEKAAFFSLAEICMNGVRRGVVTWGESVAVYGLGLLGQLTSRFCLLAGCSPVIGIDLNQFRVERLPCVKGCIGLNGTEDVKSRVAGFTDKRMADVVFETTGNAGLIPDEFAVLKRQGRFVMLSSPSGPTPSFDFHDLCNSPSYTIIGAHNCSHPEHETPYNQWTRERHFRLFMDYLSDEKLDIKDLITHRIKPDDIPEMYRTLLSGAQDVLGVVIQWK